MKTRLWLGLIPIALLPGCQAKPSKQQPPPSPSSAKPESAAQTVNATAGYSDAYSPLPAREHLWTVHWNSLTAQGSQEGGASDGQMVGVFGDIYKKEKLSLTFVSDTGHGDKANKLLSLKGHVVVKTADKRSTMTCDSLDYDSAKDLLIAHGNVKLQGAVGSVGTFTELIATSDLTKVGTPDLFNHS